MGRKSHRFAREEAQKAEGLVGGAREGPLAAQHPDKVRHDTQKPGRATAGVSQKGTSARHLLSRVEMAGLAEPPRTETA